MGTSYRPYNPQQILMMPPSLSEWVPEGHLSRFIEETVGELDLSKFYERYSGDGRRNQPFEPRMMVQILLYGYCTGTFSSRKLARKLEEDVACRYLAANNFPTHRTLSSFRKEHLELFEDLFVQVVQIAQAAGLVKLGVVAVDGTKVKANASKHRAMSYERMQERQSKLKGEIAEIKRRISGFTAKSAEIDEEEDRLFGEDFRGDELPAELQRREGRLEKIRAAKKALEERYKDDGDGSPPAKSQGNFTDSESRIMKTPNGFDQCYNQQIAVDKEGHIIIAVDVTQSGTDYQALLPMVDLVEKNTGAKPAKVLADAGYRSESNFEGLAARGIFALVSLGKEGKAKGSTASGTLKRTVQMERRLKSKRGKSLYKERKAIVEAPFAWLKAVLGFKKFSVRSLKSVTGEAFLACLAVNLRRLNHKMLWKTA